MRKGRAWLLAVWLLLSFASGAGIVAFLAPGAPGDSGPDEATAARRQPDPIARPPAVARGGEEDAVAAMALAAVRARLASAAADVPRLFEMRVHRFGPRDEVAVCGLVLGRDGTTAEPFVARVLFPGAVAAPALPVSAEASRGSGDAGSDDGAGHVRLRTRMPLVVLEEGPGLWRSGLAQRRYCREAGPPPATPPDAPAPAASEPASAAAAEPEAMVRTGTNDAAMAPPSDRRDGGVATGPGTAGWDGGGRIGVARSDPGHPPGAAAEVVVLRTPANIRSGPGGDYPVITTAPRGTAFAALGRAPGGWVWIAGAGGFEGWVHSSLLE